MALRHSIIAKGELIVELKAVKKLPDVAMAQVLSCRNGTGLKLALLLNFGEKRMVDGIKRVAL